MKLTLKIIFFAFIGILMQACAQKSEPQEKPILIDSLSSRDKNVFASGDQSPMDMSYFPPGYPLQKMSAKDSSTTPLARIVYSRPHKRGREIFGQGENSLCIYGKQWRLGANEASEIEFFTSVTIGGKKLNKGKYILYCIPYADRWTIIFNSNLYSWGLHMDSTKDVFKTDIPTMTLTPPLEDFTMVFLPANHGTDLLMAWDNVKTILPISFTE